MSPTLDAVLSHQVMSRDAEKASFARYAKLRAKHGVSHHKTVAVRNEIVTRNMRLVAKMARRYTIMPQEDVISEGVFGLATAVERFELSRGLRFNTFAKHWIFAKMQRAALTQARVVRVPVNAIRNREKKSEAWDGVSLERAPLSMDAHVVADDKPRTRHEVIADTREPADCTIDRDRECTDLRARVARLPKIERDMLTRHFGLDGKDPETLADIGKRYNLCRERARQIAEVAMDRIYAELAEAGRV